MLQVRSWYVLMLVCVFILASCAMVYAYDPNKSNEELIEEGDWIVVASWEVDANGNTIENGLVLKYVEWDGDFEIVQIAGSWGAKMVEVVAGRQVHLYFDVDNDILFELPPGNAVLLTFEYLDEGFLGDIDVHFDSHNLEGSFDKQGVYTAVWPNLKRVGDNQWKTAQLVLREARLADRMTSTKTDFRIWGNKAPFTVRKVTISVLADTL